ncbi:MAG TPA: flagellar motor protein MotB [Candidatus Acidoferrales bacterium]|nr:flagellar motor protein MotB [Candidatus Acidoferrales bacterium]
MTTKPPIIIVKKKGGHGGHHGGAWKVAYADFVTAMMALFIVLWLLNQSKKIQNAVGGYFRDPQGTAQKAGKDIIGNTAASIVPAQNMERLKAQLEKAIARVPNFDKLKNHIEMTITPEGLRIELIEGPSGTFYDSGSPNLNTDGQDLLKALAGELGKLPNKISVEGHTDAKPYSKKGNYSNWELSADRANAARRLIQANGVGAEQVTQVRGYAAMQLRNPKDPLDPSNRRISLIVHYLDAGGAAGSGGGAANTNVSTSAPDSLAAKLGGAVSAPEEP